MANPYFVFGPRPFREQRIAAYVVREHRRGRTLAEILDDRSLDRLGTRELRWRVVTDPRTIARLGHDAIADLERCTGEVAHPV
jgi:hypothetical protein